MNKLILIIVFAFLISSFFISASLVSAASARGTFTITEESSPQLSLDENNSTEKQQSTQQKNSNQQYSQQ